MKSSGSESLRHISPDLIDRNPDNPRLVFRPEEMAGLMASIRRHGIQVPLTVYQNDRRYVLIDGERRWRCARKLNLQQVPVLVRGKPSPLENLLLMFNIHALREQWDYLTIASKLPRIIELFVAERKRDPTEGELSDETGLTRGQIRRCRFILQLPEEYRQMLLAELEKPKSQQQLSEDFFIEMERALKTVRSRLPGAVKDLDQARTTLIEKYRKGTISNITEFRQLRKIATSADRLGVPTQLARDAVRHVIEPGTDVGIAKVFKAEFEERYGFERAAREVKHLTAFLKAVSQQNIDDDLRGALRALRKVLDRLVGTN